MITKDDFLKQCKIKNDGGYEAIKEFIDNGGKFKAIKGPSNTTPLHVAARNNNIKIVKLLLDYGANPMMKDKTQKAKTPLIDALEKELVDMSMVLIKAKNIKIPKGRSRYTEFSALARSKVSIDDFKKIFKELTQTGFDFDEEDHEMYTPLIKVLEQGNLDRVKACLDAGMDINGTRIQPLYYAIRHHSRKGDNTIIKYLLENGANLTSGDPAARDYFNALTIAYYHDNDDIVQLILDEYNGIDILEDSMVKEIIENRDLPFLKLFFDKVPEIQKYIMDNSEDEELISILPDDIKDVFIF